MNHTKSKDYLTLLNSTYNKKITYKEWKELYDYYFIEGNYQNIARSGVPFTLINIAVRLLNIEVISPDTDYESKRYNACRDLLSMIILKNDLQKTAQEKPEIREEIVENQQSSRIIKPVQKTRIIELWEDNIKKLDEQGFSLIKLYKKRRFQYAIAHYQDLAYYETLEPEDKKITDNSTLKGIPKILMKKRVEAMHTLDYTL